MTRKSTNVAAPTIRYPVNVPAGYHPPTGLARDAASGVWFFAQGVISGSPAETLFHWSSAQQPLASYAVDASNHALSAGIDTPIVVDHSGRAWLGINQSLLIAMPGSARLAVMSLPSVTVGAPGSGLPSLPVRNFGAIAPVESLALGPRGRIVVARAFATELQVVDPASLAVSSIPLPAGTALTGLGATDLAGDPGSGLLAAVLYSGSRVHELGQYANGTWNLSAAPCPAYAATISVQTLTVTGPGCVAAGTIHQYASTGGTAPRPAELDAVSIRDLPQGSVTAIALTSSTVLADLRSGVVSASRGLQSAPVSLGVTVPGPAIGPVPPVAGNNASSSGPVPVAMALIAPAFGGGAWFVPDAGAARVGLVTP